MSRIPEREKSLTEKLKQYFRLNKTAGVTRSRSFEQSIFLTDDLIVELQKESSPATRIKAIKEFTDTVRGRKLENFTIEKLWTLLSDLLQPQAPKETRHLVLGLFTLICQQQSEKNGLMRVKFFSFIQSHEIAEDTVQRFGFLRALTENGRDIAYFDDRIGGFLVQWTSNPLTSLTNVNAFMSFAGNVIKFNQSFIDPEVLSKIVENVCVISCSCTAKEDVRECLNVLSAVICYSSLPPGCLPTFLATLCRFINVEALDQISWKIMRDLLGTHFGHSGLLTMCQFMENLVEDVAVVRGSIFFVGAALWGNRMVRSLNYQPTSVLSSFLQALEKNHIYVTYEVISRVQDLVKNRGDTLQLMAWDLILDIVMKVTESTKTSEGKTPDNSSSQSRKIVVAVNETMDCIEAVVDTPGFCGCQEKFFAVLESCCSLRHENSVGKLFQYKVTQLLHSSRPYWFNNLINFTERYYRQEARAAIKIKALTHIASVCLSNRDTHEEDLIDKVILPYLKSLETETDVKVRQLGTQFIVDFVLVSSSKKCHDLLHILERVVSRPFEFATGDRDIVHIYTENEVVDVFTAVQGLVKIFQKKIYYLPSSIAIQAYKIIAKHLESHYKKTSVLDHCQHIRFIIFDCFFKIRANSMYHLGFPDTPAGRVSAYSPYIAVNYSDGELDSELTAGISTSPGAQSSSSPQQAGSGGGNSTPHVTFVSFSLACKLVVGSLKKEKDWKVLELILKQIPYVLENKALILSRHGNDIDHLATALCAMMMDKTVGFPESLRNTPQTFLRSDFQCFLYPILTALVSYHSHLESAVQVKIVKCLEMGLVSKSSRVCILSLSTCSLEMKDTMHKLLPEVLLALSKISPKVNIAIPVLEFLSTLIHLPRVFASFVQDQYMSIFAITFPYTNPFKFNHYTVSLAHHVIAMWFLKCRLSFRRGFVSYIIKGLEANVWAPFEEETRRSALESQNEDSSSRVRSSSLNDQSKKPRERAISGHSNAQRQSSINPSQGAPKSHLTDIKPMNKANMTFHQELTETCVDLMARYAFADCSALPTRFPSTTFLLVNGHSQTWIMDNKIITITTSGCTQKELRDGLCDKCWLLCRKPSPVLSNGSEEDGEGGLARSDSYGRRRHRSEYNAGQQSEGQKAEGNQNSDSKTKDDLHLENKLQNSKKVNGVGEQVDRVGSFGHSDWSSKSKNEHMLCTCWCQGWAEIHVRRPTGNTSWMMRIQNRVGHFSGSDILFRELSDVFLSHSSQGGAGAEAQCNTNQSIGHTPPLSSTTSSANASPSRQKSSGIGASERENSSYQESPGFTTSPNSSRNSPSEPNSPTETRSPGSPETSPSGRPLVRRSNSSPEMSDSWRSPFMTHQNQIEEDDEEDCLSISMTKPVEIQTQTSKGDDSNYKEKDKREKDRNATMPGNKGSSSGKGSSGITSPYRTSYEAIPEEVSSSLAKEAGTREAKPPSPTKSEKYLRTQQSLDENKARALQEKLKEKNAGESLPPIKRDRVHTISGINPAARAKLMQQMLATGSSSSEPYKFREFILSRESRDYDSGASATGSETSIRSGINPSFVFLQLCSQGFFGGSKPLLLPSSMESTVKVLDWIPPYETHKIGVLYVGPGQVSNETAILQNKYGSARYRDFLQGLGSLIKVSEVDGQKTFLGGLSKDGADGDYAYIWQDDVMQVMFHVATLMPNKPSDPSGNDKKRHIGNDYVAIIYNNSDEDFDISTLKGQFLYACVVVQPLDHRTNRLIVKYKPILAEHIGPAEPKIVSDQNLPIMARQLALHLNLASLIYQSMQKKDVEVDPYASNWLERLRKIKKLRTRLLDELANANNSGINDSSSDYGSNNVNAGAAGSLSMGGGSASQSYRRNFHVDDFTEFV